MPECSHAPIYRQRGRPMVRSYGYACAYEFTCGAPRSAHPTVSHNRYGFPVEPFGGMYAVVWSAQRQIPYLQSAQIRPQKIFSKIFQKGVDETAILLYTKQVVSDETSKTTTTKQDGELAEWSKAHDWKSCRRDERL